MARHAGCRVATLGQSFGGYAALQASAALGTDSIVVFAPHTRHVQHRNLFAAQRNFGPPPDVVDIRPVLVAGSIHTTIHVSRTESDNRPEDYFWDDHSHLDGLHGLPHLSIHVRDYHSHPTAWHLAKAGELATTLDRGLTCELPAGNIPERHQGAMS